MGKKIILFLSIMKKDSTEKEYRCPDNSIVSGVQTNEAPVKYLLNRNADISEIICILTKEAKESSYEFFCNSIKKIKPDIVFTEIEFISGNNFSMDVLPKIISKIGDKDEIFIEATGGKRNDILHILLLSRALTYSNVKLLDATYSDFTDGEVIYITDLFALFDFMSGMQELTSFGDAKRLREYYENREEKNTEIIEFLDAVDYLFEDIMLCRTKNIKSKMEQFNIAVNKLKNGSNDHLFDALFITFKEIFGKDKKLSISRLIKWCLKNGMIQQALTIYTERMPEEILKKDNGIFSNVPEFTGDKQEYEDEYVKLFYEVFLKLSDKNSFYNFYNKNKPVIKEYIVNNRKVKFDNYSEIIENIKIIVNTYYDNNGDLKKNYKNAKFPTGKEYLGEVDIEVNDGKVVKTSIGFVNNINSLPSEKLSILFKNTNYDFIENKNKDVRIETVESMKLSLEDSDFKLKCSIDVIKDISRDYMYIKAIRNSVNHANSESNQVELMEYLKECNPERYIDIDKININDIKKIVVSAIDTINSCK